MDRPTRPQPCAFVTGVRDGLLARHLADSPAAIADAIRAEEASLVRVIAASSTKGGRYFLSCR